MRDVSYDKWAQYLLEGIEKHGVSPKTVLEMACGTGNLTEKLVSQPWYYDAFDISESMLTVAQEKLWDKKIIWRVQNMETFSYAHKFDFIFSACDGINYLEDDEKMKRTFCNVKRHLNEGGIFCFDVSTPAKFLEELKDQTIIIDEEEVTVIWQNTMDEETLLIEMNLIFFEKNEENLYSRFEERHIQHTNSQERFCEMLKESGFNEIWVYGDCNFEIAKESDRRWHFFAK